MHHGRGGKRPYLRLVDETFVPDPMPEEFAAARRTPRKSSVLIGPDRRDRQAALRRSRELERATARHNHLLCLICFGAGLAITGLEIHRMIGL